MGKIMTWCMGLALVAALAGCGQSAAVRAVGSRGQAIEVPGLGALNKGGDAEVTSVSCGSAGNCAAGGSYRDGDRHRHGFVAVERNGVWGMAIEVPGLGALNAGGDAGVGSVSCASAGNCAAGGDYTDGHGHGQGFVADERNGVWGTAIGVPGLAALNKGGGHADVPVGVGSVSCASAGNCAAGGDYLDGDGHGQGFVADERNGVWGMAIEVPGLAALNKGAAEVTSVSCASAGNCAAGGGDGHGQGFVADERNGVWGMAIEVPGLEGLDKGGGAEVASVSCGSPGSCAAGGDYTDSGGMGMGFVAVERNGVWGQAKAPRPLNLDNAAVDSVSCAPAGNCAAGGDYGQPYGSGFVVSEKNGVWGKAIDVPGALNEGRQFPGFFLLSCDSPGNCAAGGAYADRREQWQGFVAVEKNGVWGKAIEVPGLAALNKGAAEVTSVSCVSPGSCAAGGIYQDRPGQGHFQGFVVSQTG